MGVKRLSRLAATVGGLRRAAALPKTKGASFYLHDDAAHGLAGGRDVEEALGAHFCRLEGERASERDFHGPVSGIR